MRIPFLAAMLLTGIVPAQQFADTFTYPDGPVPPGWTTRTGSWVVRNGRLAVTSSTTWAYLTRDGFQPVNSVLDAECFYGTTSGVQFCGLTSRNQGQPADNMTVMCKIRDNGAVADFDRAFIYERGSAAASTYADVVPGTASAFCRLITLDNRAWMQVDANKDGVYEQTIGPHTLTVMTGTGFVGVNAYTYSEIDNFQYFDAVLMPDPTTSPRIGTTYKVDLRAPVTTITPTLAFLSFGNAGIPLGGNRALPITADAMFSFALGLAGPLGLVRPTDATGAASYSIPLPNDPGLVGVALYLSAMTIDPAQPFSVGAISNETYFKITL